MNYTEEMKKDIQTREKKALQCLKDLELTPAAQVYKQNIGNDMFVDKVTPYLQDLKYKENEETKKSMEETPEPVEAERAGD